MTDFVKAWQCIGCGKIEAPRPCVGVCTDQRVELVYAEDYEAAQARAFRAEQKLETLATLVRKLAHTTPRAGEWEASYRALQSEARRAAAALRDDGAV